MRITKNFFFLFGVFMWFLVLDLFHVSHVIELTLALGNLLGTFAMRVWFILGIASLNLIHRQASLMLWVNMWGRCSLFLHWCLVSQDKDSVSLSMGSTYIWCWRSFCHDGYFICCSCRGLCSLLNFTKLILSILHHHHCGRYYYDLWILFLLHSHSICSSSSFFILHVFALKLH